MIDLYAAGTSNGMRARIALEECGLAYNFHPIALDKGENKTPQFLALNPNAQIPVIVDHEGPNGKPVTLSQSSAILVYAAEKSGKFMPKDPGARPAFEISGDALLGRGSFSLLDVLESESLLLGQDLGGGGAPTFLSWPAGDPAGVQIVVDGVPSGNPLAAQWDLRQIPLEGIARVAFYPGPQAAAWGGTGTGGVLAITTRRAVARSARSLLSFSVGSFDVESFSGNFGRGLGANGSFFVAANFDATQGFQNAGNFTRNQTVAKFGWRFWDRHLLEVTRRGDEVSGETSRENLTGEEDGEAKIWHAFYRGGFGPIGLRAHGWRETQVVDQAFTLREKPGLVGEGKRTGWSADVDVRLGGVVVWGSASAEERELSSAHEAFQSGGVNLLTRPRTSPGSPPRTRGRAGSWAGAWDTAIPATGGART